MADFNYNKKTHTLSCAFTGKLDTNISMELGPVIDEKVNEYKSSIPGNALNVAFDFDQVEFVTSTFIRVSVSVAKNVGKDHFSIINTNPLIKKTFKIAGLDGELNVS